MLLLNYNYNEIWTKKRIEINFKFSSKDSASESPKSLDPTSDPTKPDLLGDISEKSSSDKLVGFIQNSNSTSEIEKGVIDMQISAKNE